MCLIGCSKDYMMQSIQSFKHGAQYTVSTQQTSALMSWCAYTGTCTPHHKPVSMSLLKATAPHSILLSLQTSNLSSLSDSFSSVYRQTWFPNNIKTNNKSFLPPLPPNIISLYSIFNSSCCTLSFLSHKAFRFSGLFLLNRSA